jgi:hypothetical protein
LGFEAREGSHAADGSDWVKNDLSEHLNPLGIKRSLKRISQVQFGAIDDVIAGREPKHFVYMVNDGNSSL